MSAVMLERLLGRNLNKNDPQCKNTRIHMKEVVRYAIVQYLILELVKFRGEIGMWPDMVSITDALFHDLNIVVRPWIRHPVRIIVLPHGSSNGVCKRYLHPVREMHGLF
jgi:hypothetical protein